MTPDEYVIDELTVTYLIFVSFLLTNNPAIRYLTRAVLLAFSFGEISGSRIVSSAGTGI